MSTYLIESTASVRKQSKENLRVESLIPEQIRQNIENPNNLNLVQLLKDYYTYLNQNGQASFALNTIQQARDLDSVDNNYLNLIQTEIAVSIPRAITTDRVTLYKNLIRYYSIRGSEESISLFFKILYSDEVTISYPKNVLLIPSSGNWDTSYQTPIYDNMGALTGYSQGAYTNNLGFLSDTIKLQDSYYYQKFSYVINTGNNITIWNDTFKKLVHPAGFIYFGQILILLYPTEVVNYNPYTNNLLSMMPLEQPGIITSLDYPLILIIQPNGGVDNITQNTFYDTVGVTNVAYDSSSYSMSLVIPSGTDHNELIHFYDQCSVYQYATVTFETQITLYPWDDYTISDVINNSYTWNNTSLGVILT